MYRVLQKVKEPQKEGVPSKKLIFYVPISGDSLEHTLRACNTWVKRNYKRNQGKILKRSAPWRKRPASQKQTEYLQKSAEKIPGLTENIMHLTKGQAADMITRLVEGGIKSWKCEKKKQAKKWKLDEFLVEGPLRVQSSLNF